MQILLVIIPLRISQPALEKNPINYVWLVMTENMAFLTVILAMNPPSDLF